MAVIRTRTTTIAVKIEPTQGVDAIAGSPSASVDFLKGKVTLTYNQQTIANPEETGTLDASPSIAGGTKVGLTIECMMKGSGSGGVAPQWGKLMQVAGWQETLVTAIAGSAATAGTVSSATLGTGYGATAQAYRGMPVVLSGNPASGLVSTITDYSASKVATLAHTLGATLDTSTNAAIPAHTLYRPVSDPSLIKAASIYVFVDGLIWRVIGCAGSWKADIDTAGIGKLTFTLTGMYLDPVGGSAPSGLVFDLQQPPVLRDGVGRLGGNLVRFAKASFDAGGTLVEPENPEAVEGFDPSIITGRAAKANFDPLQSVNETIARVAAFKAGAPTSAAVAWGKVPGNRLALTIPRAQFTGFTPGDRNQLATETLPIECNAPDASIIMAVF